MTQVWTERLTAEERAWLFKEHIASNPCYYAVEELLHTISLLRALVEELRRELEAGGMHAMTRALTLTEASMRERLEEQPE